MSDRPVSFSFFGVGLQDSLCKFEIGFAAEVSIFVSPRPRLEVFFFGAEVEIQQMGVSVFLRHFHLCLENGREGFIAVLEQVFANEDGEIHDPGILAESREETPEIPPVFACLGAIG
ncbi:MAG: hypothetical protein ACJ06V_09165, partial [Verrucomicrobiota bacterium]